jgi:F0F1-type ATP synthase membrane subunit c/vacuolar-type H+-ATPase subunit K
MTHADDHGGARRPFELFGFVLSVLAALAAGWAGYRFGRTIGGGLLVGSFTGLSAAAMAAILVDAAASAIARRRRLH